MELINLLIELRMSKDGFQLANNLKVWEWYALIQPSVIHPLNYLLLVAWHFSCCSLVLLFPSSINLVRAWSSKGVFPTFLTLSWMNQGSLKGKVEEPFVSYLLTLSGSQGHQRSLRSEQDPHLSLSLWSEKSSVSCWSLEVIWKFPLGIVELSTISLHVAWISSSFCFMEKQAIYSLFCIIFLWRTRKNCPKRKVTRQIRTKEEDQLKDRTKETLNNLKSLIIKSTNHPDQLLHHRDAISKLIISIILIFLINRKFKASAFLNKMQLNLIYWIIRNCLIILIYNFWK